MSQGSKEPLVQLCPAFQVQSSPICMASYGAAPGGGVRGVPLGGKAPSAATGSAQSACVLGLELEWLAHSLAGLGQSLGWQRGVTIG